MSTPPRRSDPESLKRSEHDRRMFVQSFSTTFTILKWFLVAVAILIVFWLVWWCWVSIREEVRDLRKELEELRKEVDNNTEYVDETENCTEALCPFVDEILFRDFLGCWDANTNTDEDLNSPAVVGSTCEPGEFYRVCTAGTTLVDGEDNWNVGDIIRCFAGPVWRKTDGAEYTIRDTSALSSGEVSIIDPGGGPTEHVLLKIAGEGDITATSDGDTVTLSSNISLFFNNGSAEITLNAPEDLNAPGGREFKILKDPGTDSEFNFKPIRGIGYIEIATAGQLNLISIGILLPQLTTETDNVALDYGEDDGFCAWAGPLFGCDLDQIDTINVDAVCPLGSRIYDCTCNAVRVSGGTHITLAKVETLPAIRSCNCRCRVEAAGSNSRVRCFAQAHCIDRDGI